MTRFYLLPATAVAALVAAAPAFAAGPTPVYEEPVIAPPPAPVTDWTGGYVGGQLGWGTVDLDGIAGDPDDVDDDDLLEFDTDGDGIIGGLTAGYAYDFGQFVVGGEAQYDWADIQLDDVNVDGSLDTVLRLKALAGYDAGPALIYGTAGWARAEAEVAGTDYQDDGWVAGAGVDYLVRPNVTVGGEVLYHQFDDFDDTGIDIDATTIQLKSTFRF